MDTKRIISSKRDSTIKGLLFRYGWEWMLIVILIVVNIMNSNISPYYWDGAGLIDATMTYLDKAFIVLPMAFIIVTGYIDISVASTVALSSVVMAVSFNAGVTMPFAMVLCLLVGSLCGAFNGLLLTRFKELASMIVTLATQIIFRGIALIILGDQASGKFPKWFSFLGWGYIGPVPFILICFVVFAAIFTFVLSHTDYGRRLYAIGSNVTASRFSGINVDRAVFLNFTLAGLMAAVTGLFLTSRMGSTRPNVALSYEMDIIAMVVLGGVSTAGGKGRMVGVLIAILIVSLIRYGLGLININSQVLMIIIGALLIIAVGLPELQSILRGNRRVKQS